MARIKCDHCNGTIKTNEAMTHIRNKNKKFGGVTIKWIPIEDYEANSLNYYICTKCSDELFKFLTKGIAEDLEDGE